MPASTVTAEAVIKTVYEGDLRDQLNNSTKLLKRVEKLPATNRVGKYIKFPIHVSRNSGIGARRELETLPTAGNQGTVAAQIQLINTYGAIQLSGDAMDLVDQDYNSFLDAVDLETNKVRDDLAIDYNRQCYGDGTGSIAVTTTSGSSSTPTISSGIDRLQLNGVYDVFTAADLAADNDNVKATVTLTAIGTTTVTTSSAVTFASGDVFVRHGNANRELTGLSKIILDSGTFQTISATDYPVWKSTVNSNSGTPRPLSEGLMITVADTITIASGKQPSLAMCSKGVRRAYFALLEQQREFANTQTFTGGFKALAFTTDDGDISIDSDKDCQANTMWFINEKHLKVYQDKDWGWMDRDGSMWYRLADKDGYGARLYKRSQLATDRRNVHGKLADITEG